MFQAKTFEKKKNFYKMPLKIQFLITQLLELCGSLSREDREVGMEGMGRSDPQMGSAEYSIYYHIHNYRAPVSPNKWPQTTPYCAAAVSRSG